ALRMEIRRIDVAQGVHQPPVVLAQQLLSGLQRRGYRARLARGELDPARIGAGDRLLGRGGPAGGEARQEIPDLLPDERDVAEAELLALELLFEAFDLLAELRQLAVELRVQGDLALEIEDALVLGDDPLLFLAVKLLDAVLEDQVGLLDGEQQLRVEVQVAQAVLERAVAADEAAVVQP